MAYSILHRASAIGVGVIMLLFISLVVFLPPESELPILINEYIVFKILYFGALLCIGYYIFATIKYIIWSFVKGLELKNAKLMGHLSLVLTFIFATGAFCYGIFS